MTLQEQLATLSGTWEGTKHLWLRPGDPARLSPSVASVRSVAQGRFTVLEYTWADEGKPQDGVLLIGQESPSAPVVASWIDSWHMGGRIMTCEGTSTPDGFSVQGTYAAPPGPDWGWRIAVRFEPDQTFTFLMTNITPDGVEAPAVEVRYTRR